MKSFYKYSNLNWSQTFYTIYTLYFIKNISRYRKLIVNISQCNLFSFIYLNWSVEPDSAKLKIQKKTAEIICKNNIIKKILVRNQIILQMHLVFQNIQAVLFDEFSPTDDRDLVTVPCVESAIN